MFSETVMTRLQHQEEVSSTRAVAARSVNIWMDGAPVPLPAVKGRVLTNPVCGVSLLPVASTALVPAVPYPCRSLCSLHFRWNFLLTP